MPVGSGAGVRGSREVDAAVEAAKGRTIAATGPQVAAVVLPYFAIAGTVLASWQSPFESEQGEASLSPNRKNSGWLAVGSVGCNPVSPDYNGVDQSVDPALAPDAAVSSDDPIGAVCQEGS